MINHAPYCGRIAKWHLLHSARVNEKLGELQWVKVVCLALGYEAVSG